MKLNSELLLKTLEQLIEVGATETPCNKPHLEDDASQGLIDEINTTVRWAMDVGIFEKGDIVSQGKKVVEEAGEVLEAAKVLHATDEFSTLSDFLTARDHLMEEIGDVFVTIIIEAALAGMSVGSCLAIANRKIAGRVGKGKMVNGTFVKDKDLHLHN